MYTRGVIFFRNYTRRHDTACAFPNLLHSVNSRAYSSVPSAFKYLRLLPCTQVPYQICTPVSSHIPRVAMEQQERQQSPRSTVRTSAQPLKTRLPKLRGVPIEHIMHREAFAPGSSSREVKYSAIRPDCRMDIRVTAHSKYAQTGAREQRIGPKRTNPRSHPGSITHVFTRRTHKRRPCLNNASPVPRDSDSMLTTPADFDTFRKGLTHHGCPVETAKHQRRETGDVPRGKLHDQHRPLEANHVRPRRYWHR